jgi:hypothetical protein
MTVDSENSARLDIAIDSLLRDEARPGALGPESDLLETARVLRDALPRFHPRFSFEERLAGRLATAGRAQAWGSVVASATSSPPEPIPFPAAVAVLPSAEAVMASRRRLGLVAGGAIASGVSIAIPLAGAALLMWRRGRSSGGLL